MTTSDNRQRLNKKIKLVLFLTYFIMFWTLIAIPYKLTVIVNILFISVPILFTKKHSNELSELSSNEVYPLLVGMFAPPFVLLLRARMSFHWVLSAKFWIILIVTFVILFAVLLMVLKDTIFISRKMVLLITAALLAFGSIIHINCLFDSSQGVVYQTQVSDKHKSRGRKRITYYELEVLPWGPYDTETKILVSKSAYENYSEGDSISIVLKEGLLGIQHYNIN